MMEEQAPQPTDGGADVQVPNTHVDESENKPAVAATPPPPTTEESPLQDDPPAPLPSHDEPAEPQQSPEVDGEAITVPSPSAIQRAKEAINDGPTVVAPSSSSALERPAFLPPILPKEPPELPPPVPQQAPQAAQDAAQQQQHEDEAVGSGPPVSGGGAAPPPPPGVAMAQVSPIQAEGGAVPYSPPRGDVILSATQQVNSVGYTASKVDNDPEWNLVHPAVFTPPAAAAIEEAVKLNQTRRRRESLEKQQQETILQQERHRLKEEQDERHRIYEYNRSVRDNLLADLTARLYAAKGQCEEHLYFFKERASADAHYAAAAKKSAAQLWDEKKVAEKQLATPTTFGSLDRAVYQLSSATVKYSDRFTEMSENTASAACKHLTSLIEEIAKGIQDVKKNSAKTSRKLHSHMDTVNAAYALLQESSSAAEAGIEVRLDPYIAGVQYKAAIEEMKQAETEFNDSLQTIAQDVEKLDRRRIDLTRTILNEYIRGQRNGLVKIIKDLGDTLESVESVTNDDYFIFLGDTYDQMNNPQRRNGFEVGFMTATTETGAGGGNHLPDSSSTSHPPTTHKTTTTAVTATNPHPHGDVEKKPPPPVVPPPKAQIDSRIVACKGLPSVSDMLNNALKPVDLPLAYDFHHDVVRQAHLRRKGKVLKMWKRNYFVLTRYGFLHYFDKEDDIRPEESIPLIKCDVETHPEDNVFVLCCSRGGWMRTSRKYLLKADSDVDMVDWICSIKDCIHPGRERGRSRGESSGASQEAG